MRTLSGDRRGSLLDAIDRTVTAAGSRLLAQRLWRPSPIRRNRQLDAVACFVGDAAAQAERRSRLQARCPISPARCPAWRWPRRPARSRRDPRWHAGRADLARALLAHGRNRPGRRRGDSLRRIPTNVGSRPCPRRSLLTCRPTSATAVSCATATIRFSMRPRAARRIRRVIAALQARYAEETGVRALKIKHNNVLGYFVEVTAQPWRKTDGRAAQRDLHPPPDACRHVRFTTPELG